MFRPIALPVAIAGLLVVPCVVHAQRLDRLLDHDVMRAPTPSAPTITIQTSGGMPRWVKWGVVGAVAGGAFFAVAGQSNVDGHHSAAGDALVGAAAGFVIIGGGVAFWDHMCAGDTRSRRSGMCGG